MVTKTDITKIRVADFIIKRLNEVYGIKYVPLLTGNGSLVINDAIAKNKNITPICVFHEQDAGYIALGYSKYTNKLSVVNSTTGCASTNCITPLLGAYQDHVPILFLSGNVALNQTTRYNREKYNINLKKLGVQEADIIELVKSITKYAIMIEDTKTIKYHLDRAIDISLTHPKGPSWIDLPANIGASLIDEAELISYEKSDEIDVFDKLKINNKIVELKNNLIKYKYPLIIAGNGIRLSDTTKELEIFLKKYSLPCVVTYGGLDVISHDSNHFGGVIGIKGIRSGNFAIQNADFLLVLGACLNISQCGYMGEKFAPKAKKWVVDLDEDNHKKNTVKIDELIRCDLKYFFKYIL